MKTLAGVALASLTAIAGCRSPTQLTVEVTAEDAVCRGALATSFTVGALGELATRPASSTTLGCTGGHVGSIVLVPSGGDGDDVAFRVLASTDGSDCAKSFGPQCIEARRALHYIAHEPLTVRVPLRASCEGVKCGDPTTTCVTGVCVPATVDPGQCTGSGCGESALPSADAGTDATIADANADANEDADANANADADADADADAAADAASPDAGILLGAGAYHSCALYPDGRVACWGDDRYLQMGPLDAGPQGKFVPPTIVPGVPRGTALSQGEGAGQQCVVLEDAAVACWGANYDQQLGFVGDGGSSADAFIVPNLPPIGAVRAGVYATCAVTRDRSAIDCWGLPYYGTERPPGTSTPGVVAPITSFAVGPATECVTSAGAGVYCWGSDQDDILLDAGDTTSAVAIPGLGDAILVALGGAHACAARPGGVVACWGANDDGQLGRGFVADAGGQTSPPQDLSPLPAAIVEMGAGIGHTCVRLANGDVYCWGRDDVGQGGPGAGNAQASPIRIALSGATALAVGTNHACATIGGAQVVCWGGNNEGELGAGDPPSKGAPVAVPLPP